MITKTFTTNVTAAVASVLVSIAFVGAAVGPAHAVEETTVTATTGQVSA